MQKDSSMICEVYINNTNNSDDSKSKYDNNNEYGTYTSINSSNPHNTTEGQIL